MRSYSCWRLPIRRISVVRRSLAAALVVVGAAGIASAQIQNYAIFRNANYDQNAPDAVTGPLFYNASFDMTVTNSADANGFTVVAPTSGANYTASNPGQTNFSVFSDSFNALADFEAALPFGDYSYTINSGTLDGLTNTLTVPQEPAFPQEIPQLTPDSYSALQTFNNTTPVTLNWNTFVAPDGYDPSVFLYLIPEVTGNVILNPLNGDATSFTINPGVLSSSTNYRGFLFFSGSQRSDGQDNGAGGVPSAFVIYQNVTSFLFNTGGGTVAAAEPSAVGLALAPFVFAGAAWLRRRKK